MADNKKYSNNAKRIGISKKTRFEVFKRDKFTCQYCGRKSPDVVLEVDHIVPVCEGGTNGMTNLVTACFDCNRGKGKRKISDEKLAILNQNELEELADKKEQNEMFIAWKKEILNLENYQIDEIVSLFEDSVQNKFAINDSGRANLRKAIKTYGFNEVYESMEIAINQYLSVNISQSSVQNVIEKYRGICENRKRERQHPEYAWRNKAFNYINKFWSYTNTRMLRIIINQNVQDEESMHYMIEVAKGCSSWTEFKEEFEV